MTKTRIALVFGGRSSEHEVSCVTAGEVLKAIDRTLFDVVPIGMTKRGAFVLEEDSAEKFALNADAMPVVADNGTRIIWPSETGDQRLAVVREGVVEPLGEIDAVFPLLHGRYGEDGTIQGMLDLTGLPYVGSGVFASSAAQDKEFTKMLLSELGVRVTPGVAVRERDWRQRAASVRTKASDLQLPWFVKPARAGSSVGITKVERAEDLDSALEHAFRYDTKAIVEQGNPGRELEIGVMSGRNGGVPRTSVLGEVIVAKDAEFYDYTAKYLDESRVEVQVPAQVRDYVAEEAAEIASRVFLALDFAGLARFDFFFDDDGLVLNEINTMPGFTPRSMFPAVWQASGMTYARLIQTLIDLAIEE